MTQPTDRLLRTALRGNAAFSITCSLILLAGAGWLEPRLGVPALALRIVGVSLAPFALGLWRNAARPSVARGEAWTAVGLDLAWVAASAALVLADLWPLETAGTWTVVAVADVVLTFAILQWVGLARSKPESEALTT